MTSNKSISNEMYKELKVYRDNIQKYKNVESFARTDPELLENRNQSRDDVIDVEECENINSLPDVEMEDDTLELSESCSSSSSINQSSIEKSSLTENLKKWASKNKVPHTHVTDLLKTLSLFGITDLPKTANKLLGTPRKKLTVTKVNPGEYYHFGIEKNIMSEKFKDLNENHIEIDIGIDGVSLFHSSQVELWPIMGAIANNKNLPLFLIGCYCGSSKPNDVNVYLQDLVAEIKQLQASGIKTCDSANMKPFRVRLFTCDAPAKAFVTGSLYHTGKHSCPKCTQVGNRINHRIVFDVQKAGPRTDENFANRTHVNFHQPKFLLEKNLLETIDIGIVSQFPIEPMHLVDLGVMKKMLVSITGNKTKFDRCVIGEINNRLNDLSYKIPSEFSRNVRDLNKLKLWKATEFRVFLLYTGIVVLKDTVHPDIYYHFLLLHSAIRLLACNTLHSSNTSVAEEMIKDFVKFYPSIYGDDSVSYNIHCLLHLPESVEQYGVLDNFSAYKFENYIQFIKKIVRSPNKILQQIYRRIYEGLSVEHHIYEKYDDFKINCKKECDSYCLVKPFTPFKVMGFGYAENNHTIIGHEFEDIEDFFTEPFKSSEGLGILLCSNQKYELKTYKKSEILYKYFPIKYETKMLLIPLLHNCFNRFQN